MTPRTPSARVSSPAPRRGALAPSIADGRWWAAFTTAATVLIAVLHFIN